MPEVTLVGKRRRARARLLLDQADSNLVVLARLGNAVWATKDSDHDIHLAAQQTYHDAAQRLSYADLFYAVKLAGLVLGKQGWTGCDDTTTPSEGL